MAKPIDEATTRANLISNARACGCYEQLIKMFDHYDDLYRRAESKEERKLISMDLILSIDALFGKKGPLEVDGLVIRDK